MIILHVLLNQNPEAMMPGRGYAPGDDLVAAFSYAPLESHLFEVEDPRRSSKQRLDLDFSLCEQAYRVCNIDPEMTAGVERAVVEHYRALRNRSLSVGDIVLVQRGDDIRAYAVKGFGFSGIPLAQLPRLNNLRTAREVNA